MVDETVVEVLTTKVSIASGGLDFEDSLLDRQVRDIEGTSSEIEDQDAVLTGHLLVETVCDGCCSRLVDDTKDVETGNGARVLGRLTLWVVEECGDSDDSILDGSAKVSLSRLLHLRQHHRRDFLRSQHMHAT